MISVMSEVRWENNTERFMRVYVDGLVQDCSNSIASALESLQSCTKPSMWSYDGLFWQCDALAP